MKKQFSRTILMIAGIITVVIILVSQSFYHPPKNGLSKAKSEQNEKQHTGAKIISAPADVVPSATVQLDENIPTLLKPSTSDPERESIVSPHVKIFASYFKTLFRAIISPNAP